MRRITHAHGSLLFVATGALGTVLFGAGCSNDAPTFSSDVAPILKDNCVSCHQSGGIAPFSLTDYASAMGHARAIAESTGKREMPPMPVNNDGSCNRYENARWLTDREIDTLKAWADEGAPEGDEGTTIVPQPIVALDDPDATLDLGLEYTPNDALPDDYRCFVLPAPVTEAAFVTGYEVVPGDRRVVHHAILYQPDDAAAVTGAHDLDTGEDGAGYTCFGGPGVGAQPIALWAPGAGVVDMPPGTGVRLEPNRELILQVHYNLENGTHPDRTQVKLELAGGGVTPGTFAPVLNLDMMLPPGRARVETTASRAISPTMSFVAYGAMPHMHTLGRTLHVEAEANGETRCLVDVDRWDFHWQNAWWYDEPLELEDVSSLSIKCGYDTRSRSDTVTWGEGTADEMCISYFYVALEEQPDFNCTNAANPTFGSCVDELFAACYAPDTTGACSVAMDGTVEWSDGSRFAGQGTSPGFYGPGDDVPCIALGQTDDGAILLDGGDGQVSYVVTDAGASFTCPDGSTFDATAFDVSEFMSCRGITCPSE